MPERQSVFASRREIPQALDRRQRQAANKQDADYCQSGRQHHPATRSEIQKHSYNQLHGTSFCIPPSWIKIVADVSPLK
jgi:hypothetical protein